MKDILKTSQLEYEKSTFLIDLVKWPTGALYIEIEQIIHTEEQNSSTQVLKISPSLLTPILEVLNDFKQFIIENKQLPTKFLSDDNVKELVKRYHSGISLDELAIQFRIPVSLIEQILRNQDIEIDRSDQRKPPQDKFRRRRKRRR